MSKISFQWAVVIARRWRDKHYGNTYHAVDIELADKMLQSDITYGYEDHYKQTVHALLKSKGYDVPDNYFDFLRLDKIRYHVTDVDRRSEL